MILGNTSFNTAILKPFGSQIHIASEALWTNLCSFLLCITSHLNSVPELSSLTVLQVSEIHPTSQTCFLPVFISEKMPKQLGNELSIYLFITNASLTWRKVVKLEKPFLSLMLPFILRRSRRGFKGHLKSSLLLFDSPFNISLQFCFTKSSLLTAFVATVIFLGLQRNLRY